MNFKHGKSQLAGLVAFSLFIGAHAARAHEDNPKLQFTMRTISKDVTEVALPTKKSNPADVTDGQIWTAVSRARTANHQLQLIIDRRGSVVDGKLKEDEMTPGGLEKLSATKQKEMLDLYTDYLKKAQAKLVQMEKLLIVEYEKLKNPEARDFKGVKALVSELEAVITEAHKVFRPE